MRNTLTSAIHLTSDGVGDPINAKVADERGVRVVTVFDLDVVIGAVVILHRALHLTVDVGEHQVDALTFIQSKPISSS